LKRLDLDESKALCMYQKVIRYADVFTEQLTTFEDINQKRQGALGLVESVKAMFVKYFNFIDEQQKEKVFYILASLLCVFKKLRFSIFGHPWDLEKQTH